MDFQEYKDTLSKAVEDDRLSQMEYNNLIEGMDIVMNGEKIL